jgi:hypothetical protein
MVRTLALAAAPLREVPFAVLRTLIVCGCALALIMAGQVLPF